MSGLPAYLDLVAIAVRRHVKRGHPGVNAQMFHPTVDDLRVLERDEGLGRVHVSPDAAGRPQGAAQQVAQGAAAWCRRLRRCSGISTTSTTRPRRPGGGCKAFTRRWAWEATRTCQVLPTRLWTCTLIDSIGKGVTRLWCTPTYVQLVEGLLEPSCPRGEQGDDEVWYFMRTRKSC